MNATAAAMGMRNSHFMNMHGLTMQGHYSSAHDMTILGRHLIYDFPQYYNLFSRRTADAGIAEVANTNRRFLDAYRARMASRRVSPTLRGITLLRRPNGGLFASSPLSLAELRPRTVMRAWPSCWISGLSKPGPMSRSVRRRR